MPRVTDRAAGQKTGSVSIILPVFNNASGLRRTVEAVADQLRRSESAELIVVDDGSTDETPHALRELSVDHPFLRPLRTENGGAATARNRGAAASGGTIIIFLDANDEPLPGWLDALHRPIEEGAGLTHCAFVGLKNLDEHRHRASLPGCFGIAREVFQAIDGYDEMLGFGENTDLIGRATQHCERRSLAVVFDDRQLLRINDVSDPRRYDNKRVDAMIHLLERDAELLQGNPIHRARLAANGAVSAVRVGRSNDARHLAWVAVRARPTGLRNWTRLALVLVGPLGRRRWRPGSVPS